MNRYLILAVCMAAVILGACAKESNLPVADGEADIRALNMIPGSPNFVVLIEERLFGTADYKDMTATSEWDGLEYTFNFEALLTGEIIPTRVASSLLDVQADKDYTLVISGAYDAPDITLWEADGRVWVGTETVFEARLAHTAVSLGDIDIYLADPAIPPVLGSQVATLAAGEISPPMDFEAGEYSLTVTPAGDDTTILFTTSAITPFAGSTYILSVFDSDENDLAPFSGRLFNLTTGGTGALADSRSSSQMRFWHTSLNFGDADIYFDDPLTVPVISDHAFGDITTFMDVAEGPLPLTYTAAGNMGSILLQFDVTAFSGIRTDIFVINDGNGVDAGSLFIFDRRSIQTVAKFSVLNTAASRESVNVYLLRPDDVLDEALPFFFALPLGLAPSATSLLPESYTLYVTDVGEKVPLAGPILIDAAAGDVIQLVLYENADPTIVDVVFSPAP